MIIMMVEKVRMVMLVGLVQVVDILIIIPGDIHFDDGENWTLGSYRGINLTQVETFFGTL